MTSYQRLKGDIKYYQQCIKELEEIIACLVKQARQANIQPSYSLALSGDDFVTKYNSGLFETELLMMREND
jgi:hypothetical protein